ncbi:hypothetical protein LOTGIDRAFT_115645 [Lottia gigantea]|uniref:Ionotropic glutamate receptor L-glutamate and glycine-binding domain-containing protein n=1 Tax=Lottia gigantea TaxID=225164 RepID=V4C4I1_LOTGI|nr:hypothetical protein LOTGIDRAFT_115645 [Lottia gigantea]ESO96449.1 hypothetical protein LOTGIDRAFT_115645 [Lottia gigantea]
MKTIQDNKTIYTGICIDLLRELSVRLNFSYELIEPPDLDWGIVKDGRWTGLVGQLTRHEVDLVVAAVTITDQRETAIDFSFPYFFDYTGVYLKKPDPGIDKWYTLLAPFKWQVLLCILCALLFATFFLFTIETTNPYYDIKNNQSTRFTLDGALWYLLGALLAHGGVHIPSTMASRMIIGFWWIFSIIMAATYSGNLIAFLTVTRDTLPFETLAEMLQQDTYKWGIMGGSATETLFKNSSIDDYKEVWKNMVEFNKTDPDVFHPDQSVHLQKILAGNYAFLTDRSVLASWTNHSCNVSLLPEKIFPNHYALGLPDNSPYLDIFTNQ